MFPEPPSTDATSATWRDWFIQSAARTPDIPWSCASRITPAERTAITRSIQEFQLGESSEGKNFIAVGEKYSKQHDPEYLPTLRLFIAEEQRHARDLGRFMDLEGIPRSKHTLGDEIFRRLRKGGGLERSIRVLIVAEVIAKVYYRALWASTSSPILRALCERILDDEEAHVRFQAGRIARLQSKRSPELRGFAASLHDALFNSACMIVWVNHAKVFKSAGFTLKSFYRAAWAEWSRVSRMIETVPQAPASARPAALPLHTQWSENPVHELLR